jgi:dimethylargininase
LIAFTRAVPASLADCQLTHIERTPIDLSRAREQHAAYERALAELGCQVRRIAAADHRPDSVFVEDAAIVLDEIAVVTRPGAASRLEETEAVAASLRPVRDLCWLAAPATLDGGDVLQVGRTLFVGVGGRTNEEGAQQLQAALDEFGYRVRPLHPQGCLHLKSAVTALAPELLLVNPGWIEPAVFGSVPIIEIDPAEPFAANVLRVGDTVLCAEACPRTRARIEAAGIHTRAIDVSELAKAEGALTCCSLIMSP